jgi:hypothetical protein
MTTHGMATAPSPPTRLPAKEGSQLRVPEPVHLGHRRMPEPLHDDRLLAGGLAGPGVAGERGREHLDGHRQHPVEIDRLVDKGDAAAAEGLGEREAVKDRATQAHPRHKD